MQFVLILVVLTCGCSRDRETPGKGVYQNATAHSKVSLEALQASGRQVGLISHVPGMAERIGVQIQVVARGSGRSGIRIVG